MVSNAVSIELDKSIATPCYQQLYTGIRRNILSGELAPGFAFPPERDLVLSLGITRPTLRQAFDRLEREGLVQRRHGVGTFVTEAEHWKRDSKKVQLGIVAWTPNVEGYWKDLLGYLCAEAGELGIQVQTLGATDRRTGIPDLRKRVTESALDGLIALGTSNRRHLQQLAELRVPKVILEIRERQDGLDHVVIDSFPGVYEGVSELARLGHREIGFLGGLIGDYDKTDVEGTQKLAGDVEVRFKAYRRALEDAGIPYRPEWYAELPFTDSRVDEWVKDRHARGRLLPAYAAFDDLLAELVIHGCRECGRSVPGDVSVLGFGSIRPRARAGEIATAEFDLKEMARLAVRRLQERIERGGLSGVTFSVESRFKPGASIGPPRIAKERS